MLDYFYEHKPNPRKKFILRIVSILLMVLGVSIILYVFFPLISWQIYFANEFTQQDIQEPIPQSTLVNDTSVANLFTSASQSFSGVNYDNPKNWFPNYKFGKSGKPVIQYYTISIPKINLNNAVVSTVDTNLSKHLVNYSGTAYPPQKGNAVIFGHSTLPQLYNPKDYKTVFTYLYKLSPGDEIDVNVGNVQYKYRVESIIVVDPENTTVLQQDYDDSFLTLITCTPPGTIWKRLVVRARIENSS